MRRDRMTALSSRLTELGVPHNCEYASDRACINAMVNGIYELSVRAIIDDDPSDDMVLFSVRQDKELLRLDYDNIVKFAAVHLPEFLDKTRER